MCKKRYRVEFIMQHFARSIIQTTYLKIWKLLCNSTFIAPEKNWSINVWLTFHSTIHTSTFTFLTYFSNHRRFTLFFTTVEIYWLIDRVKNTLTKSMIINGSLLGLPVRNKNFFWRFGLAVNFLLQNIKTRTVIPQCIWK